MNSFQWAYDHEKFNQCINKMIELRINNQPNIFEIPIQERHVCSFLASHLATSDKVEHRKKALLYASLASVLDKGNPETETLCYSIFERVGALPASYHLKSVANDKCEFINHDVGCLFFEFSAAYKDAHYNIADGLVLTRFQADALASLRKNQRAVITAPTSAGKSFIVHEYVKELLKNEIEYYALFIVPTKALISQTASIYRCHKASTGADYSVYTAVNENEEFEKRNAVFVLTQERCIRLFNTEYANKLKFVFVDEIQSLEASGRGDLLEYVMGEIEHLSPSAKIFAAGPYISNADDLTQRIFQSNGKYTATTESPVSQVIVSVKPKKNENSVELKIFHDNKNAFLSTVYTKKKLYSRWKTQTNAIIDAVSMFSGDSPSIVYASGPGTARNWARKFVRDLEQSDHQSDDVQDLIDYLKESLHPNCSLIKCLLSGVAYHHGGLPDFIRDEIEFLFATRQLSTLFCTSTLLEGVNLPIEKMFIVDPRKADNPLSNFDFKNLIGRAGRLKEYLCGLVYCVQQADEDKDWPEEYQSSTVESVIPNTDKKFKDTPSLLLSVLSGDEVDCDDSVRKELEVISSLLRTKYFTDPQSVPSYLLRKDVPNNNVSNIISVLDATTKGLSLPKAIVIKNPSIDPILQNALFLSVRNDPNSWLIRSSRGFATDFERTFLKLDGIFNIIHEISPRGNLDFYRNDLLRYGKRWLFGSSFHRMVEMALPASLRGKDDIDPERVDLAITKVTDIIFKGIRYKTSRYYSLLSDVIGHSVPESDQPTFAMTMALSTMLEFGCSDPKALTLCSACIPRSAALYISNKIPDNVDPVRWLIEHQGSTELRRIPNMYRKLLVRLGLWK